MPRTRPTSVTVIGILNLIFGGLSLLCGVGLIALQLAGVESMLTNFGTRNTGNNPQIAKQKELEKDLSRFTDETDPTWLRYASSAQGLVLSLLLIISGIGLLLMQAWARALSFVYAALSILSHVAHLVYLIAVTLPAAQPILKQISARGPDEQVLAGLMNFGMYVELAVPIISLVYPAIVFMVMLRPNVAAAFRGEMAVSPQAPPVGEQIEEEDRWGHG
jgi:hypothetical protein